MSTKDPDNVVRVDFRRQVVVEADGEERPVAEPAPDTAGANPSATAPTAAAAPQPGRVVVAIDPQPPEARDARKAETCARLLDEGVVVVRFDPRVPGVVVPEHLVDQPDLALSFSYRYHIADFAHDEVGIRASLRFGEHDTFCDIPWRAVWMLLSTPAAEALLMPEDAPREVRPAIPGLARQLRATLSKG